MDIRHRVWLEDSCGGAGRNLELRDLRRRPSTHRGVPRHKGYGSDIPRLAHTSRYSAGRIWADMNKDSRLTLDERLDEAFCQADANREQANVLKREAERNPAETAALARECIPIVMEQDRVRAARICGVDITDPNWSRSSGWQQDAASLAFHDLARVYQIGNGYVVLERCHKEIVELDSDETLTEEGRATKICEAVVDAFEAVSAVWLHELAELSAWVRSSRTNA